MAQESQFLRAIWLKAFGEGEVAIHYGSKGEAVRMRLKLYNAAKKSREDPYSDPPLHQASSNCEVLVEEANGGAILRIRNSLDNPLLIEAAAQLGIPLEGPTPKGEIIDDLASLEARLKAAEDD